MEKFVAKREGSIVLILALIFAIVENVGLVTMRESLLRANAENHSVLLSVARNVKLFSVAKNVKKF